MPTFNYRGMDNEEQTVAGMVKADSLALAINHVRSLGYFPTSVNEAKRVSAEHPRHKWFSILLARNIKSREVARFARELANLVNSGISLPFSLSILYDRQSPSKLKNILGELTADVGGGMEFSEALAKHPGVFDDFFVSMVRAGEANDSLEEALARLANAEEKRETVEGRRRSKKKRSIMAFAAAISIFSYFFFFRFAPPPYFDWYFREIGLQNERIWNEYILTIACFIGLFVGMKLLFKIQAIRTIRDTIFFRLSALRRRAQKKSASDLLRTMGTLLGSNISPAETIDITRKTVSNFSIAWRLGELSEDISQGEPLLDALKKADILPPVALDMIAMGEDTSSLDSMMLRVADLYDSENKVHQEGFSEAAFWMGAVVFVGVIALAVIYQMFIVSGKGLL